MGLASGWVMVLAYTFLFFSVGPGAVPRSFLAMIAVFFGGCAFGAPWMLIPAIEMQWYKQAHFGAIHGVMMLSGIVGLLVVRIGNALLQGSLADIVVFCLWFTIVISVATSATFACFGR